MAGPSAMTRSTTEAVVEAAIVSASLRGTSAPGNSKIPVVAVVRQVLGQLEVGVSVPLASSSRRRVAAVVPRGLRRVAVTGCTRGM